MNRMMKQLEIRPMRLLAVACGLVLPLGAAHVGLAQQTATSRAQITDLAQRIAMASTLAPSLDAFANAAKPAAEEEEESPKAHAPGGNGIKVHGHWVLQVKNADGTLGERREFENSLVTTYATQDLTQFTTSGSQLMAAMLSGNVAVSDPAIGLVQGTLGPDPSEFCTPNITPFYGATCYVFTSANSIYNQPPTGTFVNVSLGLSYIANFTPIASIFISGNYTVPAGLTSIAAVQSLYGFCAPSGTTYTYSHFASSGFQLHNSGTFRNSDIPSLSCTGTATQLNTLNELEIMYPLTSTPVPGGPMTVTQGQIVQISVTISFS